MKNIKNESIDVNKLTSDNIENEMKKNATNISWLNIICSFLNSLVGLI